MDLPVGLKEDQNPSLMIVKHVISSFPLHFVSFFNFLKFKFSQKQKMPQRSCFILSNHADFALSS